jgi:3-deoxy-D-manno-octulosonic acid (KDO) 8-phosphate synthase
MNRFLDMNTIKIGSGEPLLIIAGPCVLENKAHALEIAE